MKILTANHDPEGALLPFIDQINQHKKIKYDLKKLASNIVIYDSGKTLNKEKEILQNLGIEHRMGGLYGQAKINSLNDINNEVFPEEEFFWIDFDRLLYWMLYEKGEDFASTYEHDFTNLYTQIGRTKQAFLTHPYSWRITENLINSILTRLFGVDIDCYLGSYVIKKILVKEMFVMSLVPEERSWGILTEIPVLVYLLALKKEKIANQYLQQEIEEGLLFDSFNVDGYEWDDYVKFKDEIGNYEDLGHWINSRFNSISEFKKRINSINEQIEVINKYLGDQNLYLNFDKPFLER